jgi:cellulose synthase/poly-beta-1,6-N-acetylglucosamine synthase-like glycosyltransferase
MWRAAAGFMRTYAYLIKYELDFRKAQSTELRLIPTDDGEHAITYERFAQFIAPFAELDDADLTPRYEYGEMRLTRLNWFARFLLGRLTYHHIHAQWNEYFSRLLAPFLTIFLFLSTVLTAMQVELAVQSAPQLSGSWDIFQKVCRWVSIVIIIIIIVVSAFLILLVLFIFIHNQIFAQRVLRQKRSGQNKGETGLKSGVV